MAYFKINDIDFSMYVNALKVNKAAVYNAQVNAAGDSVVDMINAKRTIEAGIIPVDADIMKQLLAAIDNVNVTLSFLNPITGVLENGIACIIPENAVEYYTIQADRVQFKAFNLTFTEL